jgi:peptidylprolyl isomerase
MSRLLSHICLVLVLIAVGCQGSAFAQGPQGRPSREKPEEGPSEKVIPQPRATPSGTVSNSTQGRSYENIDAARTAAAPKKEKLDLENTIYLDLDYGRVVIKLHPELAPQTVARFKELTRQGFYDGLIWHRVIDGFMAQTGDPKGDGTGGSGKNLPAEFNAGKHVRGALSMARSSNINSADSQFFIVLADAPHLNGQYTYFGEVVEGMEFVDQIHKGNPQRNGAVPYPDHILRMQVAADAAKTEGKQASAKTEAPVAKVAAKPAAAKPAAKPAANSN